MLQYYVENSHEAIITPEEWETIQDKFSRRSSIGSAYSGSSEPGTDVDSVYTVKETPVFSAGYYHFNIYEPKQREIYNNKNYEIKEVN